VKLVGEKADLEALASKDAKQMFNSRYLFSFELRF